MPSVELELRIAVGYDQKFDSPAFRDRIRRRILSAGSLGAHHIETDAGGSARVYIALGMSEDERVLEGEAHA